MKDLAGLLQAIAALLWPILTFVLVWRFRIEIADLLKRVKRGKFLGQELELGESLDKLNESALVAAAEVEKLPVAVETTPDDEKKLLSVASQADEDEIKTILELAQTSPKLALISLAIEIEKELREIIYCQGPAGEFRNFTFSLALKILENRGILPSQTIAALREFQNVRNQIVHGRAVASSDDILRAIDSGVIILKTLKAIPRETNIVYHPGVAIYSDKGCTQRRENVRGIILETISPGGALKSHRIFATTRTHFEKGKRVAWEWSTERSWGESWYRDPDSNDVKYAWTGSLEFVGRHLEDT